ncbi:unnamed protein product, partial [Discosporangium mesarthrocarpum]
MEGIRDAAGVDITPDLDANDFGFSHSIQQLKEDVGVTNGEEVVEATMETFDVYPGHTILILVYREVMPCKGDKSYKMPHLVKEKLARAAIFP